MSWTTITDISPIAWYKADAITGLSDGDPIDTWPDSSVNGRDLTQTGTARPLYKTGIVNSLPVARFDGSNNFMSSGSFTLSSNVCCAVVYQLAVIKNFNSFVAMHDASSPSYPNNKYLQHQYYSDGTVLHGHNPSGTFTYGFKRAAATALAFKVDTFSQYASNDSFKQFYRVNGRSDLSIVSVVGTELPTTGTSYIFLGYSGLSGSYLNGDIAEMVLYEETANKESVWLEGYFADKYNITLEPGHLFKNAAPTSAPPTYNAAGGGVRIPNIRGGADQ